MKKWMPLGAALALTAGCVGIRIGPSVEGSGTIVTESREVSGFTAVSVCCGMKLELTQGSAEALELEADDNLLPEIDTAVRGDRLIVDFEDELASYEPSRQIVVRVTAVDLEAIEVSGGGLVEAGPIAGPRLSVEMSGGGTGDFAAIDVDDLTLEMSGGGELRGTQVAAGSVEMDASGGGEAAIDRMRMESLRISLSGGGSFRAGSVEGGEVEAELSGGGELDISGLDVSSVQVGASGGGRVDLAGKTGSQTVDMSGGGSYQAGGLESIEASISMSGGGEATVWATESLAVDLSGGARVEYYGEPAVDQQIGSSDEVAPRGMR